MRYILSYLIAKFAAIPEYLWCTDDYTLQQADNTLHCALGHCGMVDNKSEEETAQINAEIAAIRELHRCFITSLIDVNDGTCTYPGGNPKARVLNYLQKLRSSPDEVLDAIDVNPQVVKDLMAYEYSQRALAKAKETKETVKYVAVTADIRQEVVELSLVNIN